MAPIASTSRLPHSDSNNSSDDDQEEEDKAKAARKLERKRARKQARLQKERDQQAATKPKQATTKLSSKKKRIIDSEEDEDEEDGIQLVLVQSKQQRSTDKDDAAVPKSKKAKLGSHEASGSASGSKERKKDKERGRPGPAIVASKAKSKSRVDSSTSSEEESLAVASKRKASLEREPSASSRSRANSQERPSATATAKSTLKSAAATLTSGGAGAKPSSSSSSSTSTSKQGSKSSGFLAPTKPTSSSSRPSLQLDTTKPRPSSTSSSSSSHPPPPLRIWTPTSSYDVPFPLSLSLSFTIHLPSPSPSRSQPPSQPLPSPAKIDSLSEASAFLEFALARGKLGGRWRALEVKRRRTGTGAGAWEVVLALSDGSGKSRNVVEVTASAKVGMGLGLGLGKDKEKEREREADQAELGGKMEIIKALVRPSQAEAFLRDIDPQLVEPLAPVAASGKGADELGWADDDDEEGERDGSHGTKEEDSQRRDTLARLFFQEFKTVHPRQRLFGIERRFKSVGDLEFADVCGELVEVVKAGTVDLGEGVRMGFGRWVGDVAVSLKASLGHIHRFCNLPHHAYLDLSIHAVQTLLDLCVAANGGPEAEEWIHGWLLRLEKDNEKVEADYKSRGVPKPTPRLPPPTPVRRVSTSTSASAPAPAPTATTTTAPPPTTVDPIPNYFALPTAAPPPLSPKRSRQDEPSVDPRAAAKRKRLSEAVLQPATEQEMAVAPEPEFVQSPQTIAARPSPSPAPAPILPPAAAAPPLARSPLEIKTEAFPSMATTSGRRTTMSPAPARSATAILQTRVSPVVARVSPSRAATRASSSVPPTTTTQARISLTRASSITRATPFGSSSSGAAPSSIVARPSASAAVASGRPPASTSRPTTNTSSYSSLIINPDRASKGHQAPTPEPTPEAEARGGRAPILYEREAVWLEEQPILDGRSLVAFGFRVDDERVVARLHASLYHDNSATVEQLPLRARVVFRRTHEDEATWPSISVNLNEGLIPLAHSSLAAGNPISALHSFEITRLVQQGANTLNLARWKTSYLPSDLRLSIQLYRAVSEEWFRAQLGDDDRTFDLYDERAKVPVPVGVSIIDPITGARIVTPVRGAQCLHLETFDLNGYLEFNRLQELGDWHCPLPSCRAYAPPTSLAICSWHAGVLNTVEADINILDIVKSDQAEEEEVKPVVVKGEQQ